MGTQGSGRKRAPVKDRFSAEDEALSSIAREVSLSHNLILKDTVINLGYVLPKSLHSFNAESLQIRFPLAQMFLFNLIPIMGPFGI